MRRCYIAFPEAGKGLSITNAKNETLLDVAVGEGGHMATQVRTGGELTVLEQEMGKSIRVKVSGVEMLIKQAHATKFSDAESRSKYSHLNAQIKSLPKSASGAFAELAGLTPMSAATQALVKSSYSRKDKKNVGGSVHSTQEQKEINAKHAKERKEHRKEHKKLP